MITGIGYHWQEFQQYRAAQSNVRKDPTLAWFEQRLEAAAAAKIETEFLLKQRRAALEAARHEKVSHCIRTSNHSVA